MVTGYVLFGVRTDFLNIIYTSLESKGLIIVTWDVASVL
jgi:hypothetical protein